MKSLFTPRYLSGSPVKDVMKLVTGDGVVNLVHKSDLPQAFLDEHFTDTLHSHGVAIHRADSLCIIRDANARRVELVMEGPIALPLSDLRDPRGYQVQV